MAGTVEQTQVKLDIGSNTIQTGAAYDWTLTHITEDTFMVADVQIGQYANKDGGYVKKLKFEPRGIVMYIQSKLGSPTQIDATWLQLRSYMIANRDTMLTIYKHGVTRTADGVIMSVKKRSEDGMAWNVPADIRVAFTALNPWLLSELVSLAFSAEVALFIAPFSIFADGFTPSYASTGTELIFDVSGDEEPSFLLTLTARGACVNPKIMNAAGDYVRAIKTLADGDVLTIYTGTKSYVRFNGAWCSRDKLSEFFQLEIGSNTLTLSADSGVTNLSAEVEYQERWQ